MTKKKTPAPRKAEKKDVEEPDLLAQMRHNPRGDWNSRHLETVSKQVGLRYTPPRGGGGHYKVSSPYLPGILTVPYRRPIKPVYIRKFVRLASAHLKAKLERQTAETLASAKEQRT